MLRTVSLLPTLLPPVTVALIWQIMFSNNYGIINKLLGEIGIDPVNWLMDVNTAFYAILVIDIWQYAPFAFLLIYASLQSVPQGQYEAAKIDGAGVLQQFVYVTLPNIANGVIMVVLLRTIDTFRLFDKVNILTKGGPANSTATITQYIYQYGVKGLKVGYGSAAALIMTVIVLILAGAYIKRSFKKQNA
jgi:multiple sugar transport system permease protein